MASNFLKTSRIQYFLEQTRASLRQGAGGVLAPETALHQRKLELLDWLIKVMACLVVAQTLYMLAITRVASLQIVPLLICAPILLFAYFAHRAKRFQWVLGAILFASYVTFAVDAAVMGVYTRFDELAYLLIPLLIGVVLLSTRYLVVLIIINLIEVLLVGILALPGTPLDSLASLLLGIVFASALALLIKRYLRLAEQDRRMEMSESESIFHGLITNVPVILVVLDNQGIITLVEGKALEDIDFDARKFIGRSVYETYPNSSQLLQECRRALAGEVFNSTLEIADLVFDVWYSPLRSDDNSIRGMIAVATDVTERRRAGDVLQQQAGLLQSVSDAIISLDLDFKIETWNRAAEDVYGWLNYEVIGRPFREIVETEQPVNWASEALSHVIENGEWQCELYQKQKDGTSIWVQASFSQLENAEGKITGIIMVGRDVTERKLADQQSLELALEREKIKLLKEFIGDSSHDFRTPLATIRTSTYLLRRKHPDITLKHLDVIDSEVDHLGHLVEDLLTLARLDRSPTMEFKPLEINALVDTVLVSLHLLLTDKKQTLTFMKGKPTFMVSGDAVELERVLVNIVTNAINYTAEGGQIVIETSADDKNVLISVRDNGMGISAEDLPYIFDRFFRVDKTRGSKTGGAGLGLPIAKKIVEAHKGRITVESTPGVGSTFGIQLPLI